MSPKDAGGWSSRGTAVRCPHCTNDRATLIETVIYGKKTKTLFCKVCALEWEEDRGDSDK